MQNEKKNVRRILVTMDVQKTFKVDSDEAKTIVNSMLIFASGKTEKALFYQMGKSYFELMKLPIESLDFPSYPNA